MDMSNELTAYKEKVKQNMYVYSLQKQGIELLQTFLRCMEVDKIHPITEEDYMDYFLAVWVPKRKKYLTDAEAFNIVYTVQDFQAYLEEKYGEESTCPLVLDLYKKDYARVYKAKKVLGEMIGDPIISIDPSIVNLEKYREYKERQQKRDTMCMYEQGIFKIDEVNKEGYIALTKVGGGKYCKVLCRPNLLQHFKEEDMLHVSLKKKIFFIYWEIEDLKAYYPSCAAHYL